MLKMVDEVFDGVFIFSGVRWTTLVKDRVFHLGDVALEIHFLSGIRVPVLVSGLDPAGSGPSLLLHLVFVTHGNVLDIDVFFIIIMRQIPSCSY